MITLGVNAHYRMLVSFWYFKQVSLIEAIEKWYYGYRPEIFIDSGAFSAMTQSETVGLAEYAQYIRNNLEVVDVYANLDVIGDPEATAANQKRLEDMGLNPLPVFHLGSPFKYLDALLEQGYTYIALGGMVAKPKPMVMAFAIRCFRMAKGRAVFHGFGCTGFPLIKALPWHSVDSSSWMMGGRYGNVPLFDPHKGDMKSVNLGDAKTWYKYSKVVRGFGFDPQLFANKGRASFHDTDTLSVLSYMAAESWLRGAHGPVMIPNQPEAGAGIKIYLADSTTNHTSNVLRQLLNREGARISV